MIAEIIQKSGRRRTGCLRLPIVGLGFLALLFGVQPGRLAKRLPLRACLLRRHSACQNDPKGQQTESGPGRHAVT